MAAYVTWWTHNTIYILPYIYIYTYTLFKYVSNRKTLGRGWCRMLVCLSPSLSLSLSPSPCESEWYYFTCHTLRASTIIHLEFNVLLSSTSHIKCFQVLSTCFDYIFFLLFSVSVCKFLSLSPLSIWMCVCVCLAFYVIKYAFSTQLVQCILIFHNSQLKSFHQTKRSTLQCYAYNCVVVSSFSIFV